MQLPQKKQLPTRRKMPITGDRLSSNCNQRRQQHARKTYVDLTERTFHDQISQSHKLIWKRKIKKRHRTEQTHLVFEGIKHTVFHKMENH